MKRTALEWFISRIDIREIPMETIRLAKELEREQIEKAYQDGLEEDIWENPLRTGKDYFYDTFEK